MNDTKQPIWKLVHLCAQELTRKGITPFTRDNLITGVQRTHPGCNPNTINPVIQGLTDNLRGGAPVAVGKDLLHSVGRGRFVLNADVAQKPDKWASVEEALRTGKVVSVEPIQDPKRAPTPKGGMPPIEGNLRAYLGARKPTARYTSFDYCFNYFQSHREEARLPELLRGEALQISCLHLGFYLASWGMFRGSSALLQRSVRHLVPLTEVIATSSSEIWELDAHMYGDGSCPVVFDTARKIRAALGPETTDTLVTKIMLGTFGCVPAFDTNFKKGFDAYFKGESGSLTFGIGGLRRLGEFYRTHSEIIERNRAQTLDFDSGKVTKRRYTRAKVIDMIFFEAGRS